MAKKKSFKDLSRGGKIAIVLSAIAQLTLMFAAFKDLSKRPAELVNGPKPAWAAASLINFVGPIAYFVFGRRK